MIKRFCDFETNEKCNKIALYIDHLDSHTILYYCHEHASFLEAELNVEIPLIDSRLGNLL